MTDEPQRAAAEAILQKFMLLISANRLEALSMLRIFDNLALKPEEDDGWSVLLGRTATGAPFHFDLKELAKSIMPYVDESSGVSNTPIEVRTETSEPSDTGDSLAPSKVLDANGRKRAEWLHEWWQGVCKVRNWPVPTDVGHSLLSMSIWAHMKCTMEEGEEAQTELDYMKPTIQ